MTDKSPKRELSLPQLLPNLLTVGGLCAGMTAIRYALVDRFEMAVALIVLAALIDSVDGFAARALGSESRLGVELDSLADFVNFGVAPALTVFLWAMQDTRSAGWIAVLVFVVCCVMRLARFSVGAKADLGTETATAFTGVPSPAGGLLAMGPIYVANVAGGAPVPPAVAGATLVVVGLLMISRVPTPSIKSARIYAENARYYLLGAVAYIAFLATWPWVTLSLSAAAYLCAVIWWNLKGLRERA